MDPNSRQPDALDHGKPDRESAVAIGYRPHTRDKDGKLVMAGKPYKDARGRTYVVMPDGSERRVEQFNGQWIFANRLKKSKKERRRERLEMEKAQTAQTI